MHIHMLTCNELPDLNEDDCVLRDKLLERGHSVTVGLWSDPVEVRSNTVVLIRSCWDYWKQPDYFIDCLRRIDRKAPLWNTPRLVEWNSDKLYLERFGAFVPIIPTIFPTFKWQNIPDWEGDEFIVKPRVSNAGNGVVRLPMSSLADVLKAAPDFPKQVMIQSFVKEIGEVGEYSMIYIGGNFSHCVHKIPGKGDFRVQHMYGGSYELKTPDDELLSVAKKAYKHILEEALYARLDFIPYQGKYCLSEAELIEPWLHFKECPAAADRMINALETRLLA